MSTVTKDAEKKVAPSHVKMTVQTTPQKPKKPEAKKPVLPAPPAPKKPEAKKEEPKLPAPPAPKEVPEALTRMGVKEEVGNKLHELQDKRKEEEKVEETKKPAIVTGVVHHESRRGKGTGKGTKFRAKMFGYWGTSVIRWMWKDGFEFVEVKTAVASLLGEQTYQDSTLRAQRQMFKSGSKTEVAPLTDAEAEQLRKFKIKK